MFKQSLRTPRLLEPLSAALIGAGSFFFLVALSHMEPLGFADRAAWRWAQPGHGEDLGRTAVRVQGPTLSSAGRHVRLAEQVAWLRKQGAGAIVLEAWFDEVPQAEAKAVIEQLQVSFAQWPADSQGKALEALSSSAGTLDADKRLATALGQAQPLVLSYATRRGAEIELPSHLRGQGYEVTLRGRRQTLAPRRAERLPYEGLLNAVARSGGVSLDGFTQDRVPATAELKGRWYNSLGLEAARLALGVPLAGLRYRWRRGVLSSLELKGARYPLDTEGRLRIPENLPELPQYEWDALQRDPKGAEKIRGKAVFFRPWPQALSDASAFDAQERLFAAVVEREVLVPEAEGAPWRLWLLAWTGAILAWAFLPAWAATLVWALPLTWLLKSFNEDPQALAQPLVLGISALSIGLGWRWQRLRRKENSVGLRFHGRIAQDQNLAWQKRLPLTGGTLKGVYLVVRPLELVRAPAFENWLRDKSGFLDSDQDSERLGIFLPELKAGKIWDAPSVLELIDLFPDGSYSAAPGEVQFTQVNRLDAIHWRLSGVCVQDSIQMNRKAKSGQFLIMEQDYADWHGKWKIQVTGFSLEAKAGSRKVLNVLFDGK